MIVFPQPSSAETEPVTLAQLKAQTRVTSSGDDALLNQHIASARAAVETATGQLLVERDVKFVLDAWPSSGRYCTGEIEFGVGPVQSVTSIVYANSAGADTALPSESYIVRERFGSTRIRIASGASWPALGTDGQITITASVGYPVDEAPEWATTAILVGAQALYDGTYTEETMEPWVGPERPVSV